MSAEVGKLLDQAWAARQQGRLDEAVSVCQHAISLNPTHVQANFALGILAQEQGRPVDAIANMRRVIEIDPNWGPALSWLAGMLLETGNLEEASTFAERALKQAPQDPNSFNNLGRAYYAQGRLTEALACFQRASSLMPNEGTLHYACGTILAELSRDDEAAIAMKQAVLLAPSAESLSSLASIQLRSGLTDDALKYGRRAVKRDPNSATAHAVLAQALMESGEAGAADSEWAAASLLATDPAMIPNQRARSLIRLGGFDAAIRDLQQSIAAKPQQGFPYFAIVSAKRIQESDRPLVGQMEALLAQPELTNDDRRYLHYALGKAYDNLGHYESAIHHFDQANQLNRQSLQGNPGFDREEFQALVDERQRIFTSDRLAKPDPARNPSTVPLFVVGMMRCGTTLAEQILSCHRDVGGAGELPFWVKNEPRCVDFAQHRVELREVSKASHEYLQILTQTSSGFSRVVDKNPANILATGLIHLAFPHAKILHIKRHPVDVALSIWMTPMDTSASFVGNRENITFAYQQTLRLAEHWRQVLPANQYMEVRYEDLIADPEAETHRMLEFCDLAWDENCLRPEHNQRSVKTPSFWQVRQPIYKSSVERWRRYEPWLGAFRDLMPD